MERRDTPNREFKARMVSAVIGPTTFCPQLPLPAFCGG